MNNSSCYTFVQTKLTIFWQLSDFVLNNIITVLCEIVTDNGMTSFGPAVCPHAH